MHTIIISQARVGSTRLPGKVLQQVNGKPFLQYHLERLMQVQRAAAVWVATTTLPQDDEIVSLCERLGVPTFRGSEDDVLSRYHGAAREARAERVVRVTSDCPLIDPQIVDLVISRFDKQATQPDYVSNTQVRSFPRGLDCEVFPIAALEEAHRYAVRKEEREHVTPYIYWRPEKFRIVQVKSPVDYSAHRWTVDTADDARLVSNLIQAGEATGKPYGLQELLAIIESNPDWPLINAHVEQKRVAK